MRYRILLIFILSVSSTILSYNDSTVGFSIDLDKNWVARSKGSNEIYFKNTLITKDSLPAYKGILRVKRYNDITSKYASAKEWCDKRSYAMELFIRSELIGGTVISRTPSKHDDIYAVIMYYQYTDTTVLAIVLEHIRFVAIGSRGYEISVTSNKPDMGKNYKDYMKILNSIRIFRNADSPDKIVVIPTEKSNHLKWNLKKILSTISFNDELTVYSLSGRILRKFSGLDGNELDTIRKSLSLYNGKNILIYKNSRTGEKISIPIISIYKKF
jgi:hypothetical protein